MLTVAITSFNTSKYLEKALNPFLEDNFVDEIIISDDKSNIINSFYLDYIVRKINNKKIKVFKNNLNLGGFSNKFIAIKKSSNKFVYLLDSDNYITNKQLEMIKEFKFAENSIIAPFKLCLFSKKTLLKPVEYNFQNENINRKNIKNIASENSELFDWFINTGNFIVNRELFLEATYRPIFQNNLKFHDACSASIFYYLVKFDMNYKIEKNFSYFHRVRNDSYWNKDVNKSIESVKFFKNKVLNL